MIIIHYIGFQLVKLLSLVDFFIEPNCSALLDDFLKIVEIDRLRTIYISFHIYSFIYIYIYIYTLVSTIQLPTESITYQMSIDSRIILQIQHELFTPSK